MSGEAHDEAWPELAAVLLDGCGSRVSGLRGGRPMDAPACDRLGAPGRMRAGGAAGPPPQLARMLSSVPRALHQAPPP